jgi:hypothetical protein
MLGEDTVPPIRAAGVLTNKVVYHGAMVGISSSYIAPATTAIRPIGVVDLEMWNDLASNGQATGATIPTPGYKIDTTGISSGVRKCVVRGGVFLMNNKSGDLVTAAHIGGPVSVEDDQTVRATAAGSVIAGILQGFNDAGLPLVLIQDNALA